MNDFYQKAVKLLEEIHPTQYYVLQIIEKYKKTFELLFSNDTSIVLCGFSPYTAEIVERLYHNFSHHIIIIDTMPEEVPSSPFYKVYDESYLDICNKNDVYISNSTVFLGYYIHLLKNKGITNILPYHALPLLDNSLNSHRKAYTKQNFISTLEHLNSNRTSYYELLSKLEDDASKQILSKFIIYVFTTDFDCIYAIKSLKSNSISDPYFGHYFIELSADEVFVDGGGYDGDTMKSFLSLCPNFKKYIYFEPETALFEKARNQHNDDRIFYHNLGLYNKKDTLKFTPNGYGMGQISEFGTVEIPVDALDNIDTTASYIKLDVEGVELEALQGAKETIIKNKSKLAISVYHNVGDIITLSSYIRTLVPDYKLYLVCANESFFNDLLLFAIY